MGVCNDVGIIEVGSPDNLVVVAAMVSGILKVSRLPTSDRATICRAPLGVRFPKHQIGLQVLTSEAQAAGALFKSLLPTFILATSTFCAHIPSRRSDSEPCLQMMNDLVECKQLSCFGNNDPLAELGFRPLAPQSQYDREAEAVIAQIGRLAYKAYRPSPLREVHARQRQPKVAPCEQNR